MKHYFFTLHKAARRSEVSDEFALNVLQNHTAYFKELGAAGSCLMAGPFVDQNGALGGGCYVFAAQDEAEAREMAGKDPLVLEGLYDFRIYEWVKVVPE